mmetsp:Transcript_1285/g.1978  ORF Transcript_1285/g.1978 Transcript_1285/m.1978 type:complete len:140 (+) Transcript_1285:402-821(+)
MDYIVDVLPPADQSDQFIRVIGASEIKNSKREIRNVFKRGIVPALTDFFGLQLNRLPQVFKAWHEEVQYTLHCHFVNDERVNRHIIISCTDTNLNVTFCPDGAATPSISLARRRLATMVKQRLQLRPRCKLRRSTRRRL